MRNLPSEYRPTGGPMFDRSRLYTGQPHTDAGERGKAALKLASPVFDVVSREDRPYWPLTITMRDLSDAMFIGMLHAKKREHPATGETIPPEKIDSHEMLWHQLDMDPDFSHAAAVQNATVEVEKRLGIYPNVAELVWED